MRTQSILHRGAIAGAAMTICIWSGNALAQSSEFPTAPPSETTTPEPNPTPTQEPTPTPTQEPTPTPSPEPTPAPTTSSSSTTSGSSQCHTTFDFETQQEKSNCADQTASSTRESTTEFVGGISDRISQVRTGFGTSRNRTSAIFKPQGGAASADGDIGASGRLSPFVVVDSSDSERKASAISRAYDQDAKTAILGFDYRISEALIAGATLNYLDSETDLDNNQGSSENKSIILGLHASRYWGNTYLDTLVTYGQIDLDVERVSPGGRFDGSTDGDFHSAELALGQLVNHKQWSFSPSVRLLHVRGSLDGYTETNISGGTGAIAYREQQFESLNARAAFQTDYVVLTDWGVLVPSLYLAHHHEYVGAEAITTTTGLRQVGEDPARNYKVIRLNLAAQFKRGLSAFLSYETLSKHEFLDRDTATLGFRYEL